MATTSGGQPRSDGQARVSTGGYGSDVIVDVLRGLGYEYIAINPGATFRGIHDSIVNHAGNAGPEIILCNHEEIAVAVAHGYSKAAGKPMAAFVHNIVGLLHSSMAIFNAWTDRAGVLVLGATGPVDAARRRAWIDWIHTANVQGESVRGFVKWDDQPASVEAAVESLIRAHHLVSSEPQGPVYICFDAAVQEDPLPEPFPLPDLSRFPKPTRFHPDPEALSEAVELLVNAKRPVVMADFLGRSQEAVDGLVRLAERLSLPVVEVEDLFSFPTRHPMHSTASGRQLLQEADVVLTLDVYDLEQSLTTLDRQTRRNEPVIRPDAKLIDVSLRQQAVKSWADVHGKLFPTALSIAADTALAVPALADQVDRRVEDTPGLASGISERRERVAALHDEAFQKARATASNASGETPLALSFIAQTLGDVVKDVDWVVGNGDLRGWMRKLWDFHSPYQNHHSRGGGGLGKGFGHAIGVALANRDNGRVTINIQSDGDLLFTPAAIWTAVHHRIPMLVVMYNNRTYGNDLGHQESVALTRGRPVENKTTGINIEDPYVDFAGMARSFGAWGEGPIERPEDLKPALERALREVVENKRVALVDVITQAL